MTEGSREGGELRWNPLTRRWVVIAPARGARPVDTAVQGSPSEPRSPPPSSAPDPTANCPFCPGNERELPAVLWEIPAEGRPEAAGGPDGPGSPGWAVRAVPNRFAAFQAGPSSTPSPARGHQEVLIETPDHWSDLARMAPDQLDRVVEGYHARYSTLAERPGVTRVILFRNRGPGAGTSLRHPHAQLYALKTASGEMDPPEMAKRDAAFRKLARETGGCPLCHPASWDASFRKRLLHDDEHFLCWVPWAAEAPFEVWIVPRRHVGDFRDLASEEARGLARLLGWVTRRYREVAGDPDYNLLLHSAGLGDTEAAQLHWWVRLRPRVGQLAGFELLSGMFVNTSSPERDAELLGG